MADVFISYHDKTNGARAAEIAATLESAGITCWYARRDVPAGGDFTHEVIKQIGDCKVFLLLLDDGAARSPHVETEVANAFGHKKIMPYQTDKKDVKRVKWVQYYLKQIQIVPFSNYDTLTKEIAMDLGRPVRTVTPEPETVTPEPQPEPELQKKTEVLVSAFTLISVIVYSICGIFLGRAASFNWLIKIPLDNFIKGVVGAFMGYYICLIVIIPIIRIKSLRPYTTSARILLGIIGFIWFIIGLIWETTSENLWTTGGAILIWVYVALFFGMCF